MYKHQQCQVPGIILPSQNYGRFFVSCFRSFYPFTPSLFALRCAFALDFRVAMHLGILDFRRMFFLVKAAMLDLSETKDHTKS